MKVKYVLSLFVSLMPVAIAAQEVTDTLAGAVVSGIRQRNSTQVGLERIDADKINSGFALFSTPDVLKTLQNLPGVSAGSELMSGLFVHGGDGSDNLYRLDGVPIYQVSHLAGMFSSFNADVIESVDFYKAGFPARFGGRLSSVVDIYTREGDYNAYHGNFSIGLIDGRLQFEGPILKDRISFNVSARRTWAELLTLPICALTRTPEKRQDIWYRFYDLNGSVSWRATSGSTLRLNLYHGRDVLHYKEQKFRNYEKAGNLMTDDSRYDVSWGNVLASLNYDWKISTSLHSNMRLYMTRNHSRFLVDRTGYNRDEWSGESQQETSIHDHNWSRVTDAGVAADFNWNTGIRHTVRFGGEFIGHFFRPETKVTDGNGNTETSRPEYTGQETALYIEDEFPVTRWMKANIGLRGVLFSFRNATRFYAEPRAALRFICSNRLSINASYSEMSQYAHKVAASYIDLPADFWMPSTSAVAPMRSRQVALGGYLTLPYGMHLDIEGWYKTMDHILEYTAVFSLLPPIDRWESVLTDGKGRSWGAEVELGWKGSNTEVNAYYTLSWSQRHFPEIWHDWYRDRNDNRHKFTIVATHRFSRKFDVYAAWHFHSGNRTTVETNLVRGDEADLWREPFYGEPNNLKFPDYHRLDVGMNWRKKTRRGNESIWNLSIYNVYCRMNAIQVVTERDKDGNYYAMAHGMIPIVPTFSWTLKF